jgi:hypothetical protein
LWPSKRGTLRKLSIFLRIEKIMQKEKQILIVINNPKMLKNLENKTRYGPKLCTEKYLEATTPVESTNRTV